MLESLLSTAKHSCLQNIIKKCVLNHFIIMHETNLENVGNFFYFFLQYGQFKFNDSNAKRTQFLQTIRTVIDPDPDFANLIPLLQAYNFHFRSLQFSTSLQLKLRIFRINLPDN